MAIVSMREGTISFGGPKLLDAATLVVEPGERVALIGRNGEGKSTLLKILAGVLKLDSGEMGLSRGATVGMLTQEIPFGISGTVFDIVAEGLGDDARLLSEYHRVGLLIARDTENASLLKELDNIQHEIDARGAWVPARKVEIVAENLKLDLDADFDSLSGGTKRRVLLARALVAGPDLLLLDEPTNHLDIDSIRWLEDFLLSQNKTLFLVTHDRTFLKKLATRIVELDRGRLVSWSCGYEGFLDRRDEAREAEQKQWDSFDKKLSEEEAWLRKGVRARRTRNEGRVRALMKLREERSQRRFRAGSARMEASGAERSGKLVFEAKDVSFGWGEKKIVTDFSTVIMRGDRVGVIGPNGSGKTTLLRLLTGDLVPETGGVRFGANVHVSYFSQMREELDGNKTVKELIGRGNETVMINGNPRHVKGYLHDFLFTPDRAESPVSILSGGERSRLLFARLFMQPSNVLVLDEPTNDLDVETLDLLEDLLLEYNGTILVVSHDRTFLNNVVTSTLVLEGNAKVNEYVGGYDDWERQRPAPVEKESAEEKKKKQRVKPDKSASSKKLTFKEKSELEALPARIEELEAELNAIHDLLADPESYKKGHEAINAATARMPELEREIAAAYDSWTELEGRSGEAVKK